MTTSPAPLPSGSPSVIQPEGNYYDKYGTKNPIARYLMDGFLRSFDHLAGQTGAQESFEAGCGEGHLSIRLARRGLNVRAIDIAPSCIDKTAANALAAGVNVPARVADIHTLTPADGAELVICCEVLEHLDNPTAALDKLAELARPWLLVSVPREPIWRVLNLCRGKYIGDLGNTPGHVQHWSARAFKRLIASRFEIVAQELPLPWTMILARKR